MQSLQKQPGPQCTLHFFITWAAAEVVVVGVVVVQK